ncbi:MAG: sensor histidine kinase, partial [Gemmataceae bacterium]
ELRRLERLRQDFVANVSHELKTPLSVIKVCVETLQDGAADDPAHRDRFLDQIARQGDRLHALILDLLSLARIESGEELFDLTTVPLVPLAAACVERHRPRAEARRQELRLEAGGDPVVWADEEAADTVLENLLDNALKYTPEGGVIRVRVTAEGGAGRLEVIDTGIGIPEVDLPRIFERFYRVDRARSRELGGTGLGLSIVKHLAQALRGTVRATSEVGVGTTFAVTFPLADP